MYVCYLQKSGVGAQKYITSKIKHGLVITVFVCLFVFSNFNQFIYSKQSVSSVMQQSYCGHLQLCRLINTHPQSPAERNQI